ARTPFVTGGTHLAASSGKSYIVPIATLQGGNDWMKDEPYRFDIARLSRIAHTPRSSADRIRRPKPCLNLRTAKGNDSSMNDESYSSLLASKIGSEGTANGNLVTTTMLSASPVTSTPSQKDNVPNTTVPGSVRSRSIRFRELPSTP